MVMPGMKLWLGILLPPALASSVLAPSPLDDDAPPSQVHQCLLQQNRDASKQMLLNEVRPASESKPAKSSSDTQSSSRLERSQPHLTEAGQSDEVDSNQMQEFDRNAMVPTYASDS